MNEGIGQKVGDLALERVPLLMRFLLGSILPAFLLGLCFLIILAGGRGKGEAPMVVFFASLVAVPAVILLNCWVLFIPWHSLLRLFAFASILPAIITLGSALFVYGSGFLQNSGLVVLLPFLCVPMRGLRLLTTVWAIAVASLLFTAWRVDARRDIRREIACKAEGESEP